MMSCLRTNPISGEFIHHIYPKELKIKDTTDTMKSTSYLNILFRDRRKGKTELYDKRHDFPLRIVNFPFICGNIPHMHLAAYGVLTSQHIRYTIACRNYIVYRARLLLISEPVLCYYKIKDITTKVLWSSS